MSFHLNDIHKMAAELQRLQLQISVGILLEDEFYKKSKEMKDELDKIPINEDCGMDCYYRTFINDIYELHKL